MRYEDDGVLFTQLMLRRYPNGEFLRAETGAEPMTCPKCGETGLPYIAYLNQEKTHNWAGAFCPRCMDGYGAAWIKWLPKPTDKRRRPNMPDGLRWRVFERDGFRCRYCGRHRDQLEEGEYLHADHVVPVSRGGKTLEANLVCACTACNLGKSDRELKAV